MSVFELWTTPSVLHAISVHIPIALAFLGIPLVYLCAVVPTERDVLRWVTAAAYGVLAITAYLASLTGERAENNLSSGLPSHVWDLVERHEELAGKVWMLAAGTMLVLTLSVVKVRWFRVTMMTLAMIVSLVIGGWVGVTAHYGGTLVYIHGVGVATAQVAPPAARVEIEPDAASRGPAESPAAPLLAVRALDPAEAARISYTRDIKPILEDRCVSCHNPGKARGGLDLTTVSSALKPGEEGVPAVIPNQPDTSNMVKYIRGELQPRMPKGKDPLTEDQLHRIRLWISAGAVDDSPATPAPQAVPEGAAPSPSPAPESAAQAPVPSPAEPALPAPAVPEPPQPPAENNTPAVPSLPLEPVPAPST